MKKLIAVLILVATSIGYGATFTWNASNVCGPTNYSFNGYDSIVATLYCADLNDGNALDSLSLTADANGVVTFSKETGNIDVVGNKEYNFYVTITTREIATGQTYMFTSGLATTKAPDSTALMQNAVVNFNRYGEWSNYAITNDSMRADAWVPVPEPTSGLLLLMGMGALALRRKQK